MRLEQLYTNYVTLSTEEREEFILQYNERRYNDLSTERIVTKKKATGKTTPSKKEKTISVTPEQMQLLKQLGLI